MNKNSLVTQVAFDKMLSWLDADRDQAGKKYEKIRRRLIEIFAGRGCREAEDLADETINRVAIKSQDVAEGYVGDPAYYFYAVAKNILLEYWKVKPPTEAPQTPEQVPADEIEREHGCLEQCLGHLPEQDRKLFLQYFSEEQRVKIDQRKELSCRLGIAPNALRIRIHRIKLVLKQCIEDCLGQTAGL
jgi:DNA-directed RNA polymerase specialized sigma24 family protein